MTKAATARLKQAIDSIQLGTDMLAGIYEESLRLTADECSSISDAVESAQEICDSLSDLIAEPAK